jgi:hypothetical protein
MFEEESRASRRRRCHGEVLVYRLAGGQPVRGALADVSSGGVRVAIDRPLPEGEAVRLVFSRGGDPSSRPGRTIVGHVAHAGRRSGSYQIGVAFAWDSALGGSPTIRRDPATPRWLRFFSRKARHRHRAAAASADR